MANNLNNLYETFKNKPWQFSLNQGLFLTELNKEEIDFENNISFSTASSDFSLNKKKQITINHSGLLGINGSLPLKYNEIYNHEEKKIFYNFIKIFEKKLLQLKYLFEKQKNYSLKKNAYLIEKRALTNNKNNINSFAYFFWKQDKNSHDLKQIIQQTFKVKANIKEFELKTFKIEDQYQLKLNNLILNNKLLGKKYKSYLNKIKINIFGNENSLKSFNKNKLIKILDEYLPKNIGYSVRIHIKKNNQEPCLLKNNILNQNIYLGKSDQLSFKIC